MGIKPQVVKAAIAAMRPEVSCDFSERPRSPQRVRPSADKIDMHSFYFMEETCEQGGSAAPLRAVGLFAPRWKLRAGSRAGGAGDAKQWRRRRVKLTSSKGLLDPPTPLLCRDLRHEREKCSV